MILSIFQYLLAWKNSITNENFKETDTQGQELLKICRHILFIKFMK
jgi:hypothetical protein